MLGKHQKKKKVVQKSKIPRILSEQKLTVRKKLNSENNKLLKKYILKLRNKMKYTLLTFFNSKK
jgi:hypothetical protein